MSKFRKRLVDDAGFTLIELLVVIAVLGILGGIAIPRITGVQDEARKNALESSANSVRNAMEMYYSIEGEYPDLSGVSDNDSLADFADDVLSGTNIDFDFSDSDHQIQSATDNSGDQSSYTLDLEDTDEEYEVTISSADGVGDVTEQ